METRSLWVLLSDEQVEARSRQLARALLDLGTEERELEAFAAEMRSTLKARRGVLDKRRGEVDGLAEAVDNRRERTSVECDWRVSLSAEAKYLIRRDTAEAVERSPLTDKERQLVLGEAQEPHEEPSKSVLKRWDTQLAELAAKRERGEE